tara:strand:- start:97 stop:756 length:660 start_codon:yes stop_codon:yes gene_type:complete
LEISKCKSYKDLSNLVADVVEHILALPEPKLILPTGSTPIGLYKELVNRQLDWSTTTTFNLDEYIINPNHPQSYHSFMKKHLFDRINIYPNNCNFPDRNTQAYEDIISEVDLCILGIGSNGHIAFNEPGSSFDSVTRVVDLTEETIKDNSRFFPTIEDVPTQAITMGLKPIMSSKKIIIMANGKHKKDILEQAMYGDITEDIPASILQTHTNMEAFYCD